MTDTNQPDEGVSSNNDGYRSGLTPFSRRMFLQATGAGVVGLTLGNGVGTGAAAPGRLHTEGRWIRDADGNDVRLQGMAPADPGFYRRFHPKTFEEVLEWTTDESRGWHPNVVRLPFTKDSVDHFGLDTYVTEIMRPAVDLLATQGVYALVDYHLIRPYTQAATDEYNDENDENLDPINDVMESFWDRVAPEFATDEHVIFELFNEPTQPAMYGDDPGAWQAWREAAQPWVDLIRQHAAETPIIIGSPRWTSVTHMAPEYPFEGENLIYAGHIYPDNGAPSEFDQYYGQPATDVPVVITEFGWDPAGGSVDQGTTSGWGEPFRNWVEGYGNMGWVSWCFDDSWAPTFFDSPDAGANEPWTLKDDPEQMGGYIKTWLAGTESDDTAAPTAPSNLSVTGTTNSSVSFAWDAATDTGGSGLSHYVIAVDGSRDHTVSADTTSTTITDLTADTEYEIGVAALDGAGNESATTTVVATTAENGGSDDLLAEIDPNTTTASVGERITFQVTDTSGSDQWITALDWAFGDGTSATGWWNEHAYDAAGTYTVALTATDNEGDTTTHEITVTVS